MKWMLSFFIVLFIIPISTAWYGSYDYRYPIINNYTTNHYPVSVNDTYGLNSTIIWSYIGNKSYAYYDSTSKLWLIANDTDQKYWENETSLTGNTPESVWDSDYRGVWHLDSLDDSTQWGNTLTDEGAPSSTTGCPFGKCYSFDGDSGRLTFAETSDTDILDNITMEAWVYPNDYKSAGVSGTYPTIFFKGTGTDASTCNFNFLFTSEDDGETGKPFCLVPKDDEWRGCTADTALPKQQWYYVGCTFDGDVVKLYINGELNKTCDVTDGSSNNADANFNIGYREATYPRAWDGKIDEPRISNQTRDAEYFKQQSYNGINNLTSLSSKETITTTTTTTVPITTTIYPFPYLFCEDEKEELLTCWLYEKSFIFAHTNVTIPITEAGVWHNITFDKQPSTPRLRIDHNYSDETNDTFTILRDGVYDIHGHISIQDSAVNPVSNIVFRFVKNGVEIDGSVREKDLDKKDWDTLGSTTVFVELNASDEIKFQFTSDQTTVSLETDRTYGVHYDSAVIKIERIA